MTYAHMLCTLNLCGPVLFLKLKVFIVMVKNICANGTFPFQNITNEELHYLLNADIHNNVTLENEDLMEFLKKLRLDDDLKI